MSTSTCWRRRCAGPPTSSCISSPCRCQARSTPSRRKPTRSSARCERPLRVRPRRQPLRAEPPERERRDQRLGLGVRPRAPGVPSHPRPDGGPPVTLGDLGQPRHAEHAGVGVDDHEVHDLPALALGRLRAAIHASAWPTSAYGPHENQRVTSGSDASSNSPRRVRGLRIAQRQTRPADHQRVVGVRRQGRLLRIHRVVGVAVDDLVDVVVGRGLVVLVDQVVLEPLGSSSSSAAERVSPQTLHSIVRTFPYSPRCRPEGTHARCRRSSPGAACDGPPR